MFTVIKNIDKSQIKSEYKLKGEKNICVPTEQFVMEDDGVIYPIVVLVHDENQVQAEEMNELIRLGATCFDTAEEFNNYRDKNKIEYDENGKPIKPKAVK